jgi:hypothetical protein
MKGNSFDPADSSRIYRNFKNVGPARSIEDIALRTLNQLFFCRILKGLKVSQSKPEFLKCDEKYRGLFLDQAMLMEFAGRPEYELSTNFLNQALEKGDECYGFLDGNVLAAYGWYSNTPTRINPADLVLHFDRRYIYMYKGFTHALYRGRRLYAIGMSRALEAYLARGYKGLVCYVESNNFSSLKSCYRMGYADFGRLYVARVCNRYFLHSDAGCRHCEFELEWLRPPGQQETAQRRDRAVG